MEFLYLFIIIQLAAYFVLDTEGLVQDIKPSSSFTYYLFCVSFSEPLVILVMVWKFSFFFCFVYYHQTVLIIILIMIFMVLLSLSSLFYGWIALKKATIS
jgi:hypothetical protein